MARPRQPVDLLVFKGKKNLTKKEIEDRKSQEVKAASDKVRPPAYLSKELKREFKKIADELINIGIMTNLDVNALERFLRAQEKWKKHNNLLENMEPVILIEDEVTGELKPEENKVYSALLINEDKLFKQCRAAASDLGLTISSRCRLVIPKSEEKEKTDEEKMFGDV